jgi:hypothetical protein
MKIAEEDQVEFTDDEAMKKNLVNWCSGDYTLKKRKDSMSPGGCFLQMTRAIERDEIG